MKMVLKMSIWLTVIVFMTSPLSKIAYAQNLDDAIDAELDDVSGGLNPSNQTKAKPASGKAPAIVDDELKIDDVELDVEPPKSQVASPKQSVPPKVDASDVDLDLGVEEASSPSPVVKETPLAPELKASPAARSGDVTLDEPNSTYEKRLAKISSGYKPVPDVNWDEIVGERRQENYSLQSGDTLWDISDTFFGDGLFWAKLWSQNGVIENPHMILRGKGIRFVAGTESDAPAIGVMDVRVASNSEVVSMNPLRERQEATAPTYREQVQTEVTAEEIESGVVLEASELIPAPELPAANKHAPTLKDLPRSFVEKKVYLNEQYDSSGLDAPASRKANISPSIFVNSYIADRTPESLGKIDEIESQEKVASNGQGVFIRLNREINQGARITFIRLRGSPKGTSGRIVDVLGVGVVDGIVKDNSNVYHATVTTTLMPVEKGALIIDTPPPRTTVDRSGTRSEAHVTVVGGEYDDKRKVIGSSSVIYLNGGSESGLKKGDILGIESKRGTRRETKYSDYRKSIAVIKIADVGQRVATAIVVSEVEPVNIGDMTTGALPEGLGGLKSETADEAAAGFGRKGSIDIE